MFRGGLASTTSRSVGGKRPRDNLPDMSDQPPSKLSATVEFLGHLPRIETGKIRRELEESR